MKLLNSRVVLLVAMNAVAVIVFPSSVAQAQTYTLLPQDVPVAPSAPAPNPFADERAGAVGFSQGVGRNVDPPFAWRPDTGQGQKLSGRMLGVYTQPVRLADGRIALWVTGVVPGAAAHRSGLEQGDILVQANGYALQSHEGLRWVVQNTSPMMNMTIINVRTQQYLSMQVSL